MMVHFNVVEMNEAVVAKTSQVSFILESLPESFLLFRSNIVMNKIAYILTTLINELQTFESLMKIKGETNVATSTRKFHRGLTSGTKSVPSSSVTKKWKKKKGGQGNKANSDATKTSKKAKAAKGICFHCNQEGYWKRNCPKYLANKKKAKQVVSQFVQGNLPSTLHLKPNDLRLAFFFVSRFTYVELEEATHNFGRSRELGDGGTLKDGRTVAVKRLCENNYKRVEQFTNEVEILSKLQHPNLVKPGTPPCIRLH
ncbi:gag/pol protein [Cucumis melo var. makuwa]|uniref:Gag/pol protein n=1 Tax=Cucumis melo var. makuwa TaxID=1194695 RepID=A0A5A7TVH0_CUCMM|nr:gag/pol protein [Cucumis melo var. makuwa]TYJ98660.1 gag/pol protein [Cucumis melo var. makuwa]